jgi:cellulose synthase (UDP-forming)
VSDNGGPKPLSLGSKILMFFVLLLGMALAVIVILAPLSIPNQAAFAVVILISALLLYRMPGRFVTMVLVALSIIVSSRYLLWRFTSTMHLANWVEYLLGAMLLGAEIYSFTVMLFGFVQSSWPLRRRPVPMPEDISSWPSVDVMIPTYNESIDVVRATVMAAQSMDWPADKLNVYLLDDGRREEFRQFADQAGVGYLTRPDNAHAKAGNINTALKKCRGDLVAIFDCDHVPTRAFLQLSVGWFMRDEKLAMVQTPHHFHTPDPFERNLKTYNRVPNEGLLFYGLILPGNDMWNAVFFCGSCAVMRRSALDEIGGIAHDTVTEDAHTGLKFHRKGFNSAYLRIPLASGLATESLSAHVGQRIRWARGMVQIWRIDNPLIGRGLNFMQRLCYNAAMIHFLNGLPRLIFLCAPLTFLILGVNIFNAPAAAVLAFAIPHLVHSIFTTSRIQGRYRHSFWAEIYEAVLAFNILIPTTLALISPKLGKFNVTEKGGLVQEDFYDRKIARPFIFLFFLNLIGIGIGIWRIVSELNPIDSVIVNLGWGCYNLIVLGAALAAAYEIKQRRRSTRLALKVPGILLLPTDHAVPCHTSNISRGGAAVEASTEIQVSTGDPLFIVMLLEGEEVTLPARVVSSNGEFVRVEFDDLSLEQERGLIRVLYSRADAWIGWTDLIKKDRPLQSWFRLIRHSLTGLPRLLAGRGRSDG